MKNYGHCLLYSLIPTGVTFIPAIFFWLITLMGIATGHENSLIDWLSLLSLLAAPCAAGIIYVGTFVAFCIVGTGKPLAIRVSVISSIVAWILYTLFLLSLLSEDFGSGWV